MGFFDALTTSPDTQLALGLLAASGPRTDPNKIGFGSRMEDAVNSVTAQQMARTQLADAQQQMQLRNIALQQQQAEWALQYPLLKSMSDRMSGQPGSASAPTAAPSAPAIAPSGGGALGSGTFGIPMGGQDAQVTGAGPGPGGSGGGSTMFPGVPDNIALPTAAFGGFKAMLPLLSKYNEPTDLMKTLAAQDLQPGSPGWNQALAANVGKINSPTRLGNSGYYDPVKGFVPLPAPAAAGFINIPDASDPSGFKAVQIGGGPTAVRTSAQAFSGGKAAGAAPYDGPVSIPTSDGRTLTLSKPEYADYQQTGVLPSRYSRSPVGASAVAQPDGDPNAASTAPQRAANDAAAIQREIALVNRSMDPPAVRQGRLDILNAELAKAQGAQPGQITPAASPSAPVVGMTPALGTAQNADAAQKASADTMQQSYSRLQSTGTTATAALDALAKMKTLAAQKNALLTAGILGTNQSAVNPSAAEYEKQRANVIALMAQQLGASGTDAGRANISESVPDFGKPKEAIADGLGTLENQINAVQLKRNFLSPVYQAGDSKQYTTLENQFDQNISPAMVPLLTMPAGPQRAAALKAAAQNPAVKARLNWAAENGLLK